MRLQLPSIMLGLMLFTNCGDNDVMQSNVCLSSQYDQEATYMNLIEGLPLSMVSRLVEQPNQEGALGRNKEGYLHVRFQLNMTRLTDYAISYKNEAALDQFVKTMRYSFSKQHSIGDFQFDAPDYLLEDKDYLPPTSEDLASGTAFFAYSLGMSLISLHQSEWYLQSSSIGAIRADIEAFRPHVVKMMDYLKNSVGLLERVDAKAPNRLLFNAIAFYSIGLYLHDQEAQAIGLDFAIIAISQTNETDGYFIEGGGWDSSYNGVAIKLGLELYTLIQNETHPQLKTKIKEAVSCAEQWQQSRILPSGKISTEGNTRVYPGGEKFVGREKDVDVLKTVVAFYYLETLTGEGAYGDLAEKVLGYYD